MSDWERLRALLVGHPMPGDKPIYNIAYLAALAFFFFAVAVFIDRQNHK